MPRTMLSLLAAFTVGTAPLPAEASEAVPSVYQALAALEARVAEIGYRLTTANVRWCTIKQPQLGLLFGDRRLYDAKQWPHARDAYRVSDVDAPFIAARASDVPAAHAGLAIGMSIARLGPSSLATADTSAFGRIDAFERAIAAHPPGLELVMIDTRGSAFHFTPLAGCASSFRVEAEDRPSGAADGRLVLISAGLARFAADDSELAAAVAHELAHNILRHRARLDTAGVDRGLGKQFGRSARLFRQTEVEADRLSVWLLAGAGYDPDAAARFWARFGQREGRPLFQAGTHPRWRDRVAALNAEAAIIAASRSAGKSLEPPLITDPPPLE